MVALVWRGRGHAEKAAIAAPSDSDGDGVIDSKDRCPDRPGLLPEGCPPRDSDGDGILDHEDPCAGEAGPMATRGCPDRDSDRDGVVDRHDTCAEIAGHARFGGCPMPDSDQDGVADPDDRCADKAEVWNGKRDADGCPDAGKAVVILQPGPRGVVRAVVAGTFTRSSRTLSAHGRNAVAVAAELVTSVGARRVSVVPLPGRGKEREAAERSRKAVRQAEAFARGLAETTYRVTITVASPDASQAEPGKGVELVLE